MRCERTLRSNNLRLFTDSEFFGLLNVYILVQEDTERAGSFSQGEVQQIITTDEVDPVTSQERQLESRCST